MAAHQKNAVAILGSGNWATALGIVLAQNVQNRTDFESSVQIYVYEEEIAPNVKLSEYMNTKHENIKYLPGIPLPKNLIANPDLTDTIKNANYLVFAIPAFFVVRCCKTILSHTRPGATALLVLRAIDRTPGESFTPIQNIVVSLLKVPTSVMACLNLPFQVVCEENTEITIGCKDHNQGAIWKSLLENSYITVFITQDLPAMELLHVCKDIIGLTLGLCDGLKLHDNSKVVAMRLGILDVISIIDHFYPSSKLAAIFLPNGIPNIVVSSFGNRARRLGKLMVENPHSNILQLEAEHLHGQRVPGPFVIRKIYTLAKKNKVLFKLRLITAVYQYLKYGDSKPFLDALDTPSSVSQFTNLKPI